MSGVALLTLALGIGVGYLLATALYATDLARIARFLNRRDRSSNARLAAGNPVPSMRRLVDAVNDELDRDAREHAEAVRHQQQFRRDLSALSHDIRTPLTGAKGYLQLASDEPAAQDRTAYLAAAASRIDSTCELLDQLFAYTKSADPDLALELEPTVVAPLVERVLVGHYPEFEARGWEPSLDVPRAATVESCPDALSRVLENLVVNALRHGAEAPRIALDDFDGARRLTISNRVEHPEQIDAERLFERFYQADTARGAQGSGLGLAVAANLMQAMGGSIDARLEGDVLAFTLTFS